MILTLKREYKTLFEENIYLKKQLNQNHLNEDLIKKIIKETISSLKPNPDFKSHILKKINRNKKLIIKNKILELANEKRLSLPEIKDILVDQDQLCSKATFYRYIERLKKRELISEIDINERKVIVRIS